MEATLGEIGERNIIESILKPRYAQNTESFGDDCASTWIASSGTLLSTTDPCPTPAATTLGFDDLYYHGWLTATINLSDLAAAGAAPLGLLSSLILPASTSLSSFIRLLDGLDDCAQEAGSRVIGGNLKEGPTVQLAAAALGWCDTRPMSRRGATPGDVICVAGEFGDFWAGYLASQRSVDLPDELKERLLRNVLKPSPKVALGSALRRSGTVSGCMDNSDGLFPSLVGLAAGGGTGAYVNFDDITFAPDVVAVASVIGIDPARLALGWGDWQLIFCTSRRNLADVEDICAANNVPIRAIGEMTPAAGVLEISLDGRTSSFPELDSQRFTPSSWFASGLQSYIDTMLTLPLP
jgi:thiamine-monophosphate kinase